MNRLYILRHGVAVPRGTPGIKNESRPLTAKGEKHLVQIGRGLLRLGLKPERIVTSPLPRARRTAEIVAKELKIGEVVELSDILHAESPAENIRDWLRGRQEIVLMLVGHNPALSGLLGLLLTGLGFPSELKKGGLAALSRSPESLAPYRLDWLATPMLLRRIRKRR